MTESSKPITDADRLNFLDEINRKMNEHYRTSYGWGVSVNHNRFALTDCNFPAVDIRTAIDAAMKGDIRNG